VILLSIVCFTLSAYWAAGEWLLDTGKPEDVRRATRMMPWNADAWRLMPQVDPEHATDHWRHVLKLAPRDVEARLALAIDAELAGRPKQAEALLLEASQLHKGYLPAWTLANFYLRQDNPEQFWRWARRAATFEVDLTALFELCLHLHPDPADLVQELNLQRSAAFEQLLTAAAKSDLLETALPIATRVAHLRTPAARDQLLWDTDQLLKQGQTRTARAYWNLVAKEGLLPYLAPTQENGDSAGLVNTDFAHASLERGFDWRPGSAEVAIAMGHGLRISLYGKQDDTAVLIRQTTLLEPRHQYELRYRYRIALPEGANPIRWQVGTALSEPLAASDWHEESWPFTAETDASELKLVSIREPGTHRAAGNVEITWVHLARTK